MSKVEKAEETVKQESRSLYNKLYSYTLTPYPSWTFSSLLFLSPLVLPQHVVPKKHLTLNPFLSFSPTSSSAPSAHPSARNLIRVAPSNLSAVLFATAVGLGGYMIQDGDVLNGSGFTMAWSTLYLLANGKKAWIGLRYLKPWPVVLSVTALGNAVLHGKRFIWKN